MLLLLLLLLPWRGRHLLLLLSLLLVETGGAVTAKAPTTLQCGTGGLERLRGQEIAADRSHTH